jgi:hypothetical protein
MKANPENFILGGFISSEDEGTGYMCIGCAMPSVSSGLSRCCGLPVVDVGD